MNIERLREVLSYNAETGILVWKQTLSPRAQAGQVAGSKTDAGYITLGLDGQVIKAHRVAWAIYYGEIPEKDIDHKNGIRSDNWIENLRQATVVENAYNQTKARNNISGFKGVSWDNTRNKWRACCTVNKKRKTLGYFLDPKVAHAALVAFRSEHHKEFANDGL